MTKLPEYLEKMRDEVSAQRTENNEDKSYIMNAQYHFRVGFNVGAQAVLKEAEGLVEALDKIYRYADPEHYIAPQAVWALPVLKAWHEKFGKGEGDE
jgi:hypothetical protein